MTLGLSLDQFSEYRNGQVQKRTKGKGNEQTEQHDDPSTANPAFCDERSNGGRNRNDGMAGDAMRKGLNLPSTRA